MRTIVTLVIVIAVLNAVGHAGTAYWKYYQFKDAAQETAVFGAMTPTTTLHEQIMEKAGKLEIPVDADQVNVKRDGQLTVIEASYVQKVELFPRYEYPISFSFSVEGMAAAGLGPVRH